MFPSLLFLITRPPHHLSQPRHDREAGYPRESGCFHGQASGHRFGRSKNTESRWVASGIGFPSIPGRKIHTGRDRRAGGKHCLCSGCFHDRPQIPYHLYHFTSDSLKAMLHKHGFAVVRHKHFLSEHVKQKLESLYVPSFIARFYSGHSYAVVAGKVNGNPSPNLHKAGR